MPVVACPSCRASLDVVPELIGRTVRCATCSNTFLATPTNDAGSAAALSAAPLRPEVPFPDRPYDDDPAPHDYQGMRRDLEPHRGTLVVVLGVVGLVLIPIMCLVFPLLEVVPLGLGIAAWIMGKNDLGRIDQGVLDPDGRGQTKAGMICGIITVAVSALTILLTIALFIIVFYVALTG